MYEKSFVYDAVGNRHTQTATGFDSGTVDYFYDDRDRLEAENATSYGYDANGNLTSKSGEATYTWDLEDRLIRVDKNDGTVVKHVYDTDGVRVRTTTTPAGGTVSVTDFLVDTSGSLSHVVAESDGSGILVAYYIRGDDLLSVIRPGEQRYFHADGLGSIRLLTDETGAVTDTYTYTAFGEQLSHVGSDVQPYQFGGEPYDPNIGFYYNRARWLSVSTGRFLSLDPFGGQLADPATLHRYFYAAANPTNFVDPSGEFSWAVTLTALAVIAILAPVGLSNLNNVGKNRGPNSTLFVNTEPIIVDGSGWTDAEALGLIYSASDVWFQQAGILLSPLSPRHVSAPTALEFSKNADPVHLLRGIGGTRHKHSIVFTREIIDACGIGDVGTLGNLTQGVAAVDRDARLVPGCLPHEIGHTFDLQKHGRNPFTLMGSGLGMPRVLTPAEADKARDFVSKRY